MPRMQQRQPALLGASVLGLDDMYTKLRAFALRHRGSARQAVYPRKVG
jgi:hypothetical protein